MFSLTAPVGYRTPAVVAALLGAVGLAQRAPRYRALADDHEALQQKPQVIVRGVENLALAATEPEHAANLRRDAAYEAKIGRYHAALKAKYLRAASRPWESVEPDPPPP
jgi:hypothetical protein